MVSIMALILLTLTCFVKILLAVDGSLEQPLMLSPLIRNRQIKQAQELSLVKDENSVIPTSHAGFITVDEKLGNHLFFWFFPSTSGAESPLVVWLNGGPGNPSTLGLFFENGPIRLKNNGYERSNISWTQTMSMLYIDNPVGVGFSYSDSGSAGYRIDQNGYSKDLYKFIEQFYLLFPEYQKRKLYIGGKSYAGKYVPAFAYRLHVEIEAGRSNISLAGIYMGGPLFDPYYQFLASSDYLLAVGAVSKKQLTRQNERFINLYRDLRRDRININTMQDLFERAVVNLNLPLDNYYSAEKTPYKELEKLMNGRALKPILHVGNISFLLLDSKVGDYMIKDILTSTKRKLAELVEKYKVLIYGGDLDALVSPAMIDAALLSMKWSRQEEYNNAERSVWWGDDGVLSGFYSSTGNLCQVVIRRPMTSRRERMT